MAQLYGHVLSVVSNYFPQVSVSPENLQLLNKGRFANAMVFRYQDDEKDLVIKDFSHCFWPIRVTLGRFFITQEINAFSRLAGVDGVAQGYYRIDKYTLAYSYVEGTSLTDLRRKGEKLPRGFFSSLERLVTKMHRRGVVHLDMRNMGNILCDSAGNPHLIDFQSSISVTWLPQWLKKIMKATDISGIYKAWNLNCLSPVPEAKQNFFKNHQSLRKRWIFKGYPFSATYYKVRAGVAFLFSQDFIRWLMEIF